MEFCYEYYTIYLYTKNDHIQANKYQKRITVSKWQQSDRFSFHVISISRKIWKEKKNNFPKEFQNEIWPIIGDHEYINIAEIKLSLEFEGQDIFPAPHANLN